MILNFLGNSAKIMLLFMNPFRGKMVSRILLIQKRFVIPAL